MWFERFQVIVLWCFWVAFMVVACTVAMFAAYLFIVVCKLWGNL